MAESPEHAHPHPDYVKIWYFLVGLLVLGIAVGFIGHVLLANVLVFTIATIKAGLVAANYMHLRFEGRMVRLIILSGVVCILIVLIGLIPDIVYVYGG